MKKIIKITSVILLSFLFVSCGLSLLGLRKKPKEFTYLYDAKYTGLDKFIYTDGVFVSNTPNTSKYLVFFHDGLTCIPDVLPTKDSINYAYPKGMPDGNMWGRYIVVDSIIKVQVIGYLGLDGGAGVSTDFFKILDSKKIQYIGYISWNGVYIKQDVIYNYQPLHNRMDSADCWLLKKKWFWTEDAWNKRSNK